MQLEERLRLQLAEFPYRRLFVGLSGGLDSMVLLHVSLGLDADLTAVHVNHGLHPQAASWEERCAELCRRLGAGFQAHRVRVADAGEAGARAARYGVFEGLLGAGDLLLLGHHRDDQAETVLLRLVQGRAPLGMPQNRRLDGGGGILRPWLATAREDLVRYARTAALDWIDDPSNSLLEFDRNFIRHEIMPKLADRWPGAAKTLATASAVHLARDALLAHLVGSEPDTGGLPGDEPGGSPAAEHLDGHRRIALQTFPGELRVSVLRLWLRGLGEFSVADRALAEFVRQLDSRVDAQPRLALERGTLRRFGASVVYVEPELNLQSSYALDLPGVLTLPHGELVVERHDAGFHADGALQVRFRNGGERLRCGGRTRSVKKLLQAARLPPWQRANWPLVYAGERLVAIAGIAVADSPDRDPRWRIFWQPRSA